MNDNKQKKAKIILNSEINNEVEENVPQREDDILGDPKMNFNYNFRGFKRISGWWVILFLLISKIPILPLNLFFLKNIFSFTIKSFLNNK